MLWKASRKVFPGCGYALSGLRYCRHRSPGQRHRGIPGCGCTLSGTPTAPAVAPVSVSATGDYSGCGFALSGRPTAPAVAPVSVSATGEDAA
ncbi:MAG: hypothetical protein E6470_04655 [Enterobacteriaceae bacterium]|nr:hypothetical protein [Enterobacteriaceae bacterium]